MRLLSSEGLEMKRVLSLLLICVLLLGLFSACGNDSGEVTIDKTELEMQVGDSHTFIITKSDKQLSLELFTWKSTDESVAMVVGGKVVALKDGSAVVVATYNNQILSCTVKVGIGDKIAPTSTATTKAKKTTTTKPKTTTTTKPKITTTTTTTTKTTLCNHQYATKTKYKCTLCGKVTKSLAYTYFTEWITENGIYGVDNKWRLTYIRDELQSEYGEYDEIYTILYYPETGKTECTSAVYFSESDTSYWTSFQFETDGKIREYYHSCDNFMTGETYHWFMGELDAAKYTRSTALTCYASGSDSGTEIITNYELNGARYYINDLLCTLPLLLSGEVGNTSDSDLTLADLGFSSFEV